MQQNRGFQLASVHVLVPIGEEAGGGGGRTLARGKRPGHLFKGAVLKPAPAGVHVPAAYRREPGGQRSGHVPASPVTAAARLRLSHHSTAPGNAPARKIPAGSGRRALIWPNTTPPELARAPVQIGSQPQQPAAMIWPHTA
jgi:hypothetical protein